MLSSLVHLKKLWEVRVHDRCCATNTESKDRKEDSKDYYLNNNQPQHYFKDYYIPPEQKKWRKQMLHKSRLCFRKRPLKITEQRCVKIFWAKPTFSWRQQEFIWNLYHILNRNKVTFDGTATPEFSLASFSVTGVEVLSVWKHDQHHCNGTWMQVVWWETVWRLCPWRLCAYMCM